MRHYNLIIFLFFMMLYPRVAASLEITLCENDIPPWVIKEAGKIAKRSLMVQFTDAVFDKIEGLSVKYVLLPWARCQEYVKQGKMDGTIYMAVSAERKKDFVFSDVTITYDEGFLYSKKKYPDGLSVDSHTDLKKYRIGLLIGYYYKTEITQMEKNKEFEYEVVMDSKQNIRKLMAGRVDLIIDGIVNAKYQLAKDGLDDLVGVSGGKLVMPSDMAYGFSKKSLALQYLPQINKAIAEVKASGLHQELLKKNYSK